MAAVMIRCPKTGQDVPTGIDTDSRTFSDLPSALANPKTHLCQGLHRLTGTMAVTCRW